jgi:hypothetical protein
LNENYNWTGYCARTINALEHYLEIKLDRPHGIQVVKLPSDLENSDETHRGFASESASQTMAQRAVRRKAQGNAHQESDRMINEGIVHLECGSNAIDSDTERVSACDRDSACNYYGMILPAGDRSWQKTIDDFFSSEYWQQ